MPVIDQDAPAPPARRSLRAPARARHARPLALEPADGLTAWATPFLAVVGVLLLVSAAITYGSEWWFARAAVADTPTPPAAVDPAELPPELPVSLEIPALKVSADVKPVSLTPERDIEVPAFGETGWYRGAPVPGNNGHAVMLGHVDSRRGPDVFYQLHTLERGQDIRVRMSTGAVVIFRVDDIVKQSKDALSKSRMWSESDHPRLALITCGGKFDKRRRSYPDNVVVYATASSIVPGPEPQMLGVPAAEPAPVPPDAATANLPRRAGSSSIQ